MSPRRPESSKLGEPVIPIEASIRIFVVLLYVPVCLTVYWRLFPSLSPISKRLASLILAAQIIVLVVWLGFRLTSESQGRLWHLDRERNIPAALASTQLALGSVLALVTAWLARARQTWHRLYLAGLGLVFFFFAWDEFFQVHEYVANWEIYYALLGATVVAATVLVAAHSPKRFRKWHICLLTGLVMSAIGAIVLDLLRYSEICEPLAYFGTEGGKCLLYNLEESFEFLGVWLMLVATLGQFSETAPRPRLGVRLFLYMIPALVFGHLMSYTAYLYELEPFQSQVKREVTRLQRELSRLALQLEYQTHFQPVSVRYEADIELQAYRIDRDEEVIAVQLLMSTTSWHNYTGLGYSAHLVDQVTGDSVVGIDDSASRRHSWRTTDRAWVYKQRMEVSLPPQIPTNRALWVVLTTWREHDEGFVRQKILSSDQRLLDDTQVVLGELVYPAETVAPSSVPVAEYDNGFTLNAVDMPEHAQAGETMSISFTWSTDKDGREDFVQFLHFGHVESGAWWVHDQQPLGPRLPTRVWYSGLGDSKPGRFRCRQIWRPGDILSLPGYIAQAIKRVCQPPMLRAHLLSTRACALGRADY